MGYQLDPEGNETRTIHALVDFRAMDVLEVGCGDGRLTWRYAPLTRSVLGLDPNAARIEQATAATPEALKDVVRFQAADITDVDLPERAFDVAILSWSL